MTVTAPATKPPGDAGGATDNAASSSAGAGAGAGQRRPPLRRQSSVRGAQTPEWLAGFDERRVEDCHGEHSRARDTPATMLTALAMGVAFGFALNRGHVYLPQVVTEQMSMQRFIMMKMFLSALATSLAVYELLLRVPFTRQYAHRARCLFVLGHRRSSAALVGGAVLGAGMYLGGSCPGTVYVQFGALLPTAPLVFAGGILAAIVYAFVQPHLQPYLNQQMPSFRSVDEHPNENVRSHASGIRVLLAVALALMLAVLEVLVPWTSEVPISAADMAGKSFLFWPAWPPLASGVVVGLLQFVAVIAIGDTLGSSQSYMTLVANTLMRRVASEKHIGQFRDGKFNWWQVFYVVGAVLGSALALHLAGGPALVTTQQVPPLVTMASGFLLVFGARLAGGCTSGHGISGVSLLATNSLVAMPAMFAGGMLTALVL